MPKTGVLYSHKLWVYGMHKAGVPYSQKPRLRSMPKTGILFSHKQSNGHLHYRLYFDLNKSR
jgi:hypothetical protein